MLVIPKISKTNNILLFSKKISKQQHYYQLTSKKNCSSLQHPHLPSPHYSTSPTPPTTPKLHPQYMNSPTPPTTPKQHLPSTTPSHLLRTSPKQHHPTPTTHPPNNRQPPFPSIF